jgi:capsular polysaccharide biosynthesis protein
MITMKKSELHTVRQVITANWLIAFCTWLAVIIRKLLAINDNTNIIHNPHLKALRTMPWLRWLVAVFMPKRPSFNPREVHVGFEVDGVAHTGRCFFHVVEFFPCQHNSPTLH